MDKYAAQADSIVPAVKQRLDNTLSILTTFVQKQSIDLDTKAKAHFAALDKVSKDAIKAVTDVKKETLKTVTDAKTGTLKAFTDAKATIDAAVKTGVKDPLNEALGKLEKCAQTGQLYDATGQKCASPVWLHQCTLCAV